MCVWGSAGEEAAASGSGAAVAAVLRQALLQAASGVPPPVRSCVPPGGLPCLSQLPEGGHGVCQAFGPPTRRIHQ